MRLFFLIIFYTNLIFVKAQVPENQPLILNNEFDQEIRSMLDFSVPIMSCSELSKLSKEEKNGVVLLDARELKEYEISHIPGAEHIGYNKFLKEKLDHVDKDKKIVVYCSIGYRSEKIGEKIIDLGFTNVFNLYGSIFEWVNQGQKIENIKDQETDELHTYNKKWSKWVEEGAVKKKW